jgi:uncharacterized protein YegP (UPF0339 family)
MLRFKVQPSADGQWFFEIQGGNNETLATSETYHRQADALHAAQLIATGAATATMVIADGDGSL